MQRDRVKATLKSPAARTLVALFVPGLLALVAVRTLGARANGVAAVAVTLAVAAIAVMGIGLRWYRPPEMGLRGHRALFAGIGFSVLGWAGFLVARLLLAPFDGWAFGGAFVAFFFYLIFEAACVQLWAFGLFFRASAEWRGPLAATIGSGLLFGVLGFLLFQESFSDGLNGLLYFCIWGVLLGVIRLRTGGWLGMVPVQALQSLTAWYILQPRWAIRETIWTPAATPSAGDLAALGNLYLAAAAIYLLLIWRLWPKSEEDYRV